MEGERTRRCSIVGTLVVLVLLLTSGGAAAGDRTTTGARAERAAAEPRAKAYGFTAGAPVLTMSDAVLATQLDASVEAEVLDAVAFADAGTLEPVSSLLEDVTAPPTEAP